MESSHAPGGQITYQNIMSIEPSVLAIVKASPFSGKFLNVSYFLIRKFLVQYLLI